MSLVEPDSAQAKADATPDPQPAPHAHQDRASALVTLLVEDLSLSQDEILGLALETDRRVYQWLPGRDVPLAMLAREFVEKMGGRGMLDESFFERLQRFMPGMSAEIGRVATLWHVSDLPSAPARGGAIISRWTSFIVRANPGAKVQAMAYLVTGLVVSLALVIGFVQMVGVGEKVRESLGAQTSLFGSFSDRLTAWAEKNNLLQERQGEILKAQEDAAQREAKAGEAQSKSASALLSLQREIMCLDAQKSLLGDLSKPRETLLPGEKDRAKEERQTALETFILNHRLTFGGAVELLKFNLSGLRFEPQTGSGKGIIRAGCEEFVPKPVKLEDCPVTAGLNLSGADFSDADLEGATFINTNLCKSKFINTTINGLKFIDGNLSQLDLKNANRKEIQGGAPGSMTATPIDGLLIMGKTELVDMSGSKLTGLTLTNPTVRNVDLRNANLDSLKMRSDKSRGAVLVGRVVSASASNMEISDGSIEFSIEETPAKKTNKQTIQDLSLSGGTFERSGVVLRAHGAPTVDLSATTWEKSSLEGSAGNYFGAYYVSTLGHVNLRGAKFLGEITSTSTIVTNSAGTTGAAGVGSSAGTTLTREEAKVRNLNLGGADLTNTIFLVANLENVVLSFADMENAQFLSSIFSKVNMNYVNLCGTQFRNSDLMAIIDGVDFRGSVYCSATFDPALGDVAAIETVLRSEGACRWIQPSESRQMSGQFVQISGCNIPFVDLTHSIDLDWTGIVSGLTITESNLFGVDFSGVRISRVSFGANVNLNDANFSDAQLIAGSTASRVTFSAGVSLDGTDFTGADLSGAYFTGVDLRKAKGLEKNPTLTRAACEEELTMLPKGFYCRDREIRKVVPAPPPPPPLPLVAPATPPPLPSPPLSPTLPIGP